VQNGTTNTTGTGDYNIGGLHSGNYTVQAASVGYQTKEQGAVVTANTTTTVNLTLNTAPTGPVLHAYDALGRLIQVTDPSGDSAFYHYDAVGNITAIDRLGAGTVGLSGFAPISGAPGTTVTISGSGFSTTQAQNAVTFSGTAAAVVSATTTQDTATVPAGATTGPIGVTTPTGSATSATPFTVLSTNGRPTITGFTPSIAPTGEAVTITGTNFES